MKSIKTLIAAMLVAMATLANAQTNYVHIILNDNSEVHYSQNDIKSMVIDTKAPVTPLDFETFTTGTGDAKKTVKVAKMNLGATTVAGSAETSYGKYYAWGANDSYATVEFSAYNAGIVSGTSFVPVNSPFYDNDLGHYYKYTGEVDGVDDGVIADGRVTLEADDDVVKVKMPGYHMPTQAELQTLCDACGGTSIKGTISTDQNAYPSTSGIYWVTGATAAVKIGDDIYRVNGMLFVQQDGDTNHNVFFPAAGEIVEDEFAKNSNNESTLGINGSYWSASLATGGENIDCGYSLYFGSTFINYVSSEYRYHGLPIRPFKD